MAEKFENLEVRILSRQLVHYLGKIFYHKDFRNWSFQDQIMRACISIGNNISEGRERSSNKEFVRFLYYSKGSSGEVRNMLYYALDFGYINQEQFDLFHKECIKITIKLYRLIESLR